MGKEAEIATSVMSGNLPKIPGVGAGAGAAAGVTGALGALSTATALTGKDLLAAHEAYERERAAGVWGGPHQKGGARHTPNSGLSTEGIVLGATTMALVGGGALKMLIDSLVKD